MCVVLDHGRHHVTELESVIQTEIWHVHRMVKTASATAGELHQLNGNAAAAEKIILDWRGRLIEQVEEATEKAINHLLSEKEQLKKQVHETTENICHVSQLTAVLEKLPGVHESIQEGINKAEQVFKGISTSPAFLEELLTIKTDLQNVLDSDNFNWNLPWDKLNCPLPTFDQNMSVYEKKLGRIDVCCVDNMWAELKQSVEYKYGIVKAVVASFGSDCCAVALKFGLGGIYEIHNHECKNGQDEKPQENLVGWPHDMALTPAQHIAILNDVETDNGSDTCITVYDPSRKECVGSTKCKNLKNALSFSVDIVGRYVVLSNGEGVSRYERDVQKFTVLNEAGVVMDVFTSQNGKALRDLERVACGGRYFYVLGKNVINVYEIVQGKVNAVNSIYVGRYIEDIAATPADDVFVSVGQYVNDVDVYLAFRNGEYTRRQKWHRLFSIERLPGVLSKIDVKDYWIIAASGCKFSIYQMKAD
jgi:hypothetical protein